MGEDQGIRGGVRSFPKLILVLVCVLSGAGTGFIIHQNRALSAWRKVPGKGRMAIGIRIDGVPPDRFDRLAGEVQNVWNQVETPGFAMYLDTDFQNWRKAGWMRLEFDAAPDRLPAAKRCSEAIRSHLLKLGVASQTCAVDDTGAIH